MVPRSSFMLLLTLVLSLLLSSLTASLSHVSSRGGRRLARQTQNYELKLTNDDYKHQDPNEALRVNGVAEVERVSLAWGRLVLLRILTPFSRDESKDHHMAGVPTTPYPAVY